MSGQTNTWGELLYKNANIGATLSTFTAEASLTTAATIGPQPIIPGGFFQPRPQSAGQAIKVVARGVMSTFTSGTFGLNLRGSTTPNVITGPVWLGTSATQAMTISQTGVYWELEGLMTLAAVSSAALSSLRGFGKFWSPAVATPFVVPAWANNASPGLVGGAATFDTTVPWFLSLSALFSVSNAANAITLEELEIYGLN